MKQYKIKTISTILISLLVIWPLLSISVTADKKEEQNEGDVIVIGADTEDSIALDKSTEIAELLEITPHAAIISDTLGEFGEKSGDKNEFLITDLDICNISKSPINIEETISATLIYKGDYQFEPYSSTITDEESQVFIGSWEGLWYLAGMREVRMAFEEVDSEGNILGHVEFEPCVEEGVKACNWTGSYKLTGHETPEYLSWVFEADNNDWIENPNNLGVVPFELWVVDTNTLSGHSYASEGPCYLKRTNNPVTVQLDVMEESTYPLVFKCPNRIVNDLDNCSLIISIAEEAYEIPLK